MTGPQLTIGQALDLIELIRGTPLRQPSGDDVDTEVDAEAAAWRTALDDAGVPHRWQR